MILLALALAAASPAETPRDFISRVYTEYHNDGFSPLAKPEAFFSPVLVKEIRKDSAGGEVGYLDGDPLCDCQDYEKLTVKVLQIRQPSANAATAHVLVTLEANATRDLQLRLVRTGSGWRIADVIGGDHHSLLVELQRANAKR